MGKYPEGLLMIVEVIISFLAIWAGKEILTQMYEDTDSPEVQSTINNSLDALDTLEAGVEDAQDVYDATSKLPRKILD